MDRPGTGQCSGSSLTTECVVCVQGLVHRPWSSLSVKPSSFNLISTHESALKLRKLTLCTAAPRGPAATWLEVGCLSNSSPQSWSAERAPRNAPGRLYTDGAFRESHHCCPLVPSATARRAGSRQRRATVIRDFEPTEGLAAATHRQRTEPAQESYAAEAA